MKRILLLVCACMMLQHVNCQSDTTSDRKEISLVQYLESIGVDCPAEIDDEGYTIKWLVMGDLLSPKPGQSEYDALEPIGIYAFRTLTPHQIPCILLKYYDKCELLYLSENDIFSMLNMDPYEELRDFNLIMRDLIDYFDRYPDLERRFLPIYMQAICDIYIKHMLRREEGLLE